MLFESFEAVKAYMGHCESKPWPESAGSPRATRLVKLGARAYGVQYHDTVVVTFRPSGITLTTDGWFSMTTKRRMNACLPANTRVTERRGVWYLNQWVFEDGDQVPWGGFGSCGS